MASWREGTKKRYEVLKLHVTHNIVFLSEHVKLTLATSVLR
jgi:hypothetical protein